MGNKNEAAARILVIDDDKDLCSMLHASLEKFGYIVESFSDSPKALNRFDTQDFDAVITDFLMPELNGFDVTRHVKSIKPQVPVILVTGERMVFDDASFAGSGIDIFIAKPYRIHTIVNTLKKVMRKSADEE